MSQSQKSGTEQGTEMGSNEETRRCCPAEKQQICCEASEKEACCGGPDESHCTCHFSGKG